MSWFSRLFRRNRFLYTNDDLLFGIYESKNKPYKPAYVCLPLESIDEDEDDEEGEMSKFSTHRIDTGLQPDRKEAGPYEIVQGETGHILMEAGRISIESATARAEELAKEFPQSTFLVYGPLKVVKANIPVEVKDF